MQSSPVRFDVENIIKAPMAPNVVGADENMPIPQGGVALFQLPGLDGGACGNHQFPGFSYLLKSGLFNIYSNAIGSSLDSSSPKHEDKLYDTLSSSIRRAVLDSLSMGNLSNVNIRGSLTISVEDQKPQTITFTDGAVCLATKANVSATPSKRKAYHPVKYTGSTPSPSSSSSTMNPPHLSGCTTPSVSESCALDLSKGISAVHSAQITPLKEEQAPKAQSSPLNLLTLSKQGSLQSLYQTQRNMFGSSTTKQFSTHPCDTAPGPAKRRRIASNTIRKSNSARQFACNQCETVFGSLQDLEEHTTNIHGSYRCHICNAKFTQRSNLQRHALKHVGFKPFECCLCARAYFRKDHLMRHMETTHPGVPARANIRVRLTSSESLDYLSRILGTGNNLEDAEREMEDNEKETKDPECPISQDDAEAVVNGIQSDGSDDSTKSPDPFSIDSTPMEKKGLYYPHTPCPDE